MSVFFGVDDDFDRLPLAQQVKRVLIPAEGEGMRRNLLKRQYIAFDDARSLFKVVFA